jgi:hypothetical protein
MHLCIYLVITFILAFGLRPKKASSSFSLYIYCVQYKACFGTFTKMKASASISCNCKYNHQLQLSSNLFPPSPISRQINFPLLHQRRPRLRFTDSTGDHINPPQCSNLIINFIPLLIYIIIAIKLYTDGSRGGERAYVSAWDEKPYEILESGKKAYLDEADIVTFLDPPKDLIPLDPSSYNPAAYLW